MKRTHIIPQIPKGIQDPAVEKHLRDMQKLFQAKHEDDYMSQSTPTVSVNGVDISVDSLLQRVAELTNIHQIVQKHVTDPATYAYTATRTSAVEIALLTTSITTTVVDSQIAIDMLIGGEVFQDSVLILERVINGVATELGAPPQVGSRFRGITTGGIYDGENNTTPFMMPIQFIDSPAVAKGTVITYRVKVYGTASAFFLNRTVTDTDATIFERMSSNVRLTEFGGTPTITGAVISDIASTAEAQAGVDDTKIITPKKLRDAFNAEGSAPVYACRAWVNFNGGLYTINKRGSGNVSSITDLGVGDYQINFTIPMPDTNYVVSGMCSDYVTNNNHVAQISLKRTTGGLPGNMSVNSVEVITNFDTQATILYDMNTICVAVFR